MILKRLSGEGRDLWSLKNIAGKRACRIFGKEEALMSVSLYGESEAERYEKLQRLYSERFDTIPIYTVGCRFPYGS